MITAKEAKNRTLESDKIKEVLRDEYIREYCQNKKIQLIEISYKASIEEIKTIIQSLC